MESGWWCGRPPVPSTRVPGVIMRVTPDPSVTPDPYGATMLNILKFLLFVLRHGGETPTNVRNDASGSEPTNLQPLFPNPPPRLFNQRHHHHH